MEALVIAAALLGAGALASSLRILKEYERARRRVQGEEGEEEG